MKIKAVLPANETKSISYVQMERTSTENAYMLSNPIVNISEIGKHFLVSVPWVWRGNPSIAR
jgi:hypothetical protein